MSLFGGITKVATSTTNNIDASVQTGNESPAVSQGLQANEQGSVTNTDASGYASRAVSQQGVLAEASNVNVGGVTLTNTQGGVQITSADPAIAKSAIDAVASLAAQQATQSTQAQQENNAQLSKLAEAKRADDSSAVKKNVIWLAVAGMAALLGLVYFLRR